MKSVISLNGLDKSGKSTQISRLIDHKKLCTIAPKLSYYTEWPNLQGQDLYNWWFEYGDTHKIIETIYYCLTKRNASIKEIKDPIVFVDRGDPMFDAICIATASIRERIPLEYAKEKVLEIKSKFSLERITDEDIFLRTGSSVNEMLELSDSHFRNDPSFTAQANRTYRKYQRELASILLLQQQEGEYSVILDAKRSEDEIFSRIQDAVIGSTRGKIDISNLDLMVGLGGLSECGKSSSGEYLRDIHSFHRIKIGDLLERIRQRCEHLINRFSGDIYTASDELLANLFMYEIIEELERDRRKVVIESLHNYGFTLQLKKICGPKFKIIYVETPRDIRIKRNSRNLDVSLEESEIRIMTKDHVKIGRGAMLVRNIADKILNNSGLIDEFQSELNRFLEL